MKDEAALNQFLKNEVNLNQSRYDNAKARLRTLEKHLKDNLEGFEDTEIQGSYATKTIIKPVQDSHEYDIDLMVYVKDDGSDPADVVSKVEDCLAENSFYKENMDVQKRSVQIKYANQFKIDVVPCVERNGSKWVCNSADNEWEITDGSGYKNWLNDQNRKSNGHLKHVVRLLKHLRDYKRTFTVRSIALTTLVGMAVEATTSDRLNTLPNALEAISEWIDNYLQGHQVPDLKNPVLPEEHFNRHWTDTQYGNFRKMFQSYTKRIKEAIDCKDPEKSEKLWQGIFGSKYSRSNPGDSSHGGGGGDKPQPPKNNPPSSGGISRTGSSLAIPAFAAPRTFRPPSPYATTLAPASRSIEEHDLTPLSLDNIKWLNANQQELTHNAREGWIMGTIRVRAVWDSLAQKFTVNPLPTQIIRGLLVDDEFHIAIQLRYRTRRVGSNPTIPSRHPIVAEVGGRTIHLAKKLNVSIADLHVFPSGECCLGFNVLAPNKDKFSLSRFIERDVTPWLYRLAFVERFGLLKSESALWAAYDHAKGPSEYLTGIRKIALANVTSQAPCPCGSGGQYSHCHLAEVEQCKRDSLF